MSVARIRPIAALLLCFHLGGCTTWKPVQVSPREYIEVEDPYKIRFRDATGEWVEVSNPRIEGDTIAGTTFGMLQNGRIGAIRVRVGVVDIGSIDGRFVNMPQTVVAIGVVSSVLVGAILCVTGLVCTSGEQVN